MTATKMKSTSSEPVATQADGIGGCSTPAPHNTKEGRGFFMASAAGRRHRRTVLLMGKQILRQQGERNTHQSESRTLILV